MIEICTDASVIVSYPLSCHSKKNPLLGVHRLPLTQQMFLQPNALYVLTLPLLSAALSLLFRFIRGSHSTAGTRAKFARCSLTLGLLKGRRSDACCFLYFTQVSPSRGAYKVKPNDSIPCYDKTMSTGCHTQVWVSFPDNRRSEG